MRLTACLPVRLFFLGGGGEYFHVTTDLDTYRDKFRYL